MRFPLVLAGVSFAILAQAQNFSSYVPTCAPPCVEQALNSTKACTGLDDNKCLCTNFSEIIFPARICFVQTCNNTNIAELRSEITSGWQKFCNDSGTPVNLSSGWNPGGPEFPVPSSSSTSLTSSSPSPTSSPTSSSSPAPSDTAPAKSSGLTTGAKAGIGVGAGIGSLAVIGGLLFLGFRLGQQKRKERDEPDGTSPSNEGAQAEDGRGTAGTAAEDGGEHWAYKVQPEGIPLAELPSPHVELPADNVRRELPAHERPAELWHGVMPHELDSDAEVPRDHRAAR